METVEGLKAALAEIRRQFDRHITEKGYGAHMDRHAKDHKDLDGTLDRIPTGVGGSAPTGASYVTVAAEAGLTSERRVAAGNAIGLTDGGANSTLTIALNIAGQVIGDIIYHTGAAWARLAGNTTATKKFLTQTGDGAASAAPGWGTIADADVPATHSGSTHTDYVAKSLFDAQSVLAATADNTPAALVVAEQEVVGRLTGANVDGIALGIADNNVVQIDAADVADNEYARFTANGLEGRTEAEFKGDFNLEDADIKALAVTGVEAEATLDLTGDVTVAAAKTLALDHVIEKTAGHGIVLDGVLLKDNQVYSGVDDTSAGAFTAYGGASDVGGKLVLHMAADQDTAFEDFSIEAYADDLRVRHNAANDLVVKDDRSIEVTTGPLKVDHIGELSAGHGIVLDGVELKDDAVETDAIRGLRETSGPTALTVGTITDGEFLKRVGATIVSATPAGGGGVSDAAFSF